MGAVPNKGPMGLKEPKPEKNPGYLAQVRQLRCCICQKYGLVQLSITTAHHPMHERFSNRKRPDLDAIPLCDGHHQGNFDDSKIAYHLDRSEWTENYGPDIDYIAPTQKKLGVWKSDE